VIDGSGALVLQPVTVVSFTEDVALVSAGVADGDQVVTLGVQKLEPGTRVRTVDDARWQATVHRTTNRQSSGAS
jgi:hypothetical protein